MNARLPLRDPNAPVGAIAISSGRPLKSLGRFRLTLFP